MRKYLVTAAIIAAISFSGPARAFEGEWGPRKGDWELNLMGYSYSQKYNNYDATYTGTGINATVGYFLLESVEVGGVFEISSRKSSGNDTSGNSSDSFYPNVFVAYHLNIAGNLTPFAGLKVGSGSTKYEDGSKTDDTHGGIMLGAKHFFTERAAFAAQLDYSIYSKKFASGNTGNGSEFNLNFGVSVFF